MTAVATPTAPPLLAVAPTTAASDRPVAAPAVLDLTQMADALAATPDPAAVLSQLVLAVASRSATAAQQGRVLSVVHNACASMIKSVREALLSAVNKTEGTYAGFTVSTRAGSRSLDYARLETEYPDVYDELVTVGAPSLTVKYTG
ncbi:hypothetical protein [Mycolicibacterium sp.]|uniref:hypothetical protein n=1 Tax=Mycolicibacterium sp. TaxID=2320850 RepID=UPI00355FFC3D